MSRRRMATTEHDEPATVPAVVTPARADWSDWSREQEQKRIARNVAETEKAMQTPIYPREIAERIAEDYKKQVPDWRLLKLETGGLIQKLVRQQPEWKQREIQQRGEVITLIRKGLPTHLRPLVDDYETILNLMAEAREAAAFLIGFCTGRKAQRVYDSIRDRKMAGRLGRLTLDGNK